MLLVYFQRIKLTPENGEKVNSWRDDDSICILEPNSQVAAGANVKGRAQIFATREAIDHPVDVGCTHHRHHLLDTRARKVRPGCCRDLGPTRVRVENCACDQIVPFLVPMTQARSGSFRTWGQVQAKEIFNKKNTETRNKKRQRCAQGCCRQGRT